MNATFVIHFLSTPYRKSHRACRDISSCVQQVVICKHTRTNASACTQNRWEDHLKNEVKDKRSSCMTLLRRVLLPALLTQERKANKWKHAEILFIDVIFAVLTQIPVNTERVGGNDRDSGRKSSGPWRTPNKEKHAETLLHQRHFSWFISVLQRQKVLWRTQRCCFMNWGSGHLHACQENFQCMHRNGLLYFATRT